MDVADPTDCKWIICQIGAREHYSVARALNDLGRLAGVITDIWFPPNHPAASFMPARLRERWHEELREKVVLAPSLSFLGREILDRACMKSPWRQIRARNARFQEIALRRLDQFHGKDLVVFSYSYAAGDIFAEAKRRGWRTVLGQIDPGPVEARLVSNLYEEAGQTQYHEPFPEEYWALWRREIDLSDRIVVNSEWSRQALLKEGVPEEKLAIIPLAYELSNERKHYEFPIAFSPQRPLRLLFLGQVTLRKGINLVFQALDHLPGVPVSIDIVGPIQADVPAHIRDDPRIQIHGPVPRGQTGKFYRDADVFLFPTLSDGFGLTQLEALAMGLPVIASKFCGDVVKDGFNGRLLHSANAEDLANIIRELASNPDELAQMQKNAFVEERFHLQAVGQKFLELMA